MTTIPDSHRDLLDRPILAVLATLQPDNQPQVTPVWADLHDGFVRINTAAGRQKHKNLIARPKATLLVMDPDDQYRYIEIRGTVARVSEEDGDAVIDKLAKDYLGTETYPFRVPGERRVTFYIRPEHVVVSG